MSSKRLGQNLVFANGHLPGSPDYPTTAALHLFLSLLMIPVHTITEKRGARLQSVHY